MNKIIVCLIIVFIAGRITNSAILPLRNYKEFTLKRSNDELFPTDQFSLVTDDKLNQLKILADANNNIKLHNLYHAVQHYVELARKNKEYVLWKYDYDAEGLILVVRKLLNGILFYG